MEQSPESPLISVIVPAYNAERFLAKTLDSILAQTYPHFEVLVIDDGSTDQTAAIAQAYAQRDPRIHYLKQANGGVAAARNLGIGEAKGVFIAPIDADDIWYPENLERQVQCFLAAGERVGLVYSWSVDIDEADHLLGGFRASDLEGKVYPTLILHNFLGNASAALIRRSCWEQVGGFDPSFRAQQAQGCEDWDLYLRIAERFEFRVVPAFLVGYRKLRGTMSGDYRQMARSHALVMQAVQTRHPEIPQRLYQLAQTNLYMYFAQQGIRFNQFKVGLGWLGRALQTNALFAVFYVGMVLLIASLMQYGLCRLLQGWLAGFGQKWGLSLPETGMPQTTVESAEPISMLTIADLERRQRAIQLTLAIGHVYRRVAALITGDVIDRQPTPEPTAEEVLP